jgi:predicted small lipoprotein YifL
MSQDSIALRRRPSPAARIVLALMVAAMLAGCGKKGNPMPPADEPNTYPQPYPKQ